MNEEEKELVEGIKQYPTHRELCLIHVIERLDEELNNRIPRKDIEKYYKDTRKQRRKEYLHKYYVEKIKPKRKKNKE